MRRFETIRDQFSRVQDVQAALKREGLDQAQLVIGIDYTKSNEWTGKKSFGGKCLHQTRRSPHDPVNPYEEAISIITRTLAPFDADQWINAYGFGDANTGSTAVFCLNPNDIPCKGGEQVLQRYQQITPYVKMAGPTSFGPIIRQAIHLTQQSQNQFHILIIIADGQVTRSADTPQGFLSEFEQDTSSAIIEASKVPLSIIVIGVGDGPWDEMKIFDDQLPTRQFDNFQFVNFGEIMHQFGGDAQTRDAQFALRSFMEVPIQYNKLKQMNYMTPGHRAQVRVTKPLDPPIPPPGAPQAPCFPVPTHNPQHNPKHQPHAAPHHQIPPPHQTMPPMGGHPAQPPTAGWATASHGYPPAQGGGIPGMGAPQGGGIPGMGGPQASAPPVGPPPAGWAMGAHTNPYGQQPGQHGQQQPGQPGQYGQQGGVQGGMPAGGPGGMPGGGPGGMPGAGAGGAPPSGYPGGPPAKQGGVYKY